MNLIEMLILWLITAAVVVVSKVLGGFLTVDFWIVAIPLIAAILSRLLLPWLRTSPRRLSEMPYLGVIASTIVAVAYIAHVTNRSSGIELPPLIISYGIAALVLVFIASWWTHAIAMRPKRIRLIMVHRGNNIKRNVVFKADGFNTTEPKPYFVNDGCFGDDLGKWLIPSLKSNGVEVESEPGQEDFGWYIRFRVEGVDYQMPITCRPGDEGELGDWMCTIEKQTGLLGNFLGDSRKVLPEASAAIHAALLQPPCTDIRWYSDEDYRHEQNATPVPL